MKTNREASSFRDPAGYVYYLGNRVRRVVKPIYRTHYELFIRSGLKEKLVKDRLLIDFYEIRDNRKTADLMLESERVPFISYPYEWCFGQLKDAALTTLAIEKTALDYGMTLKDASAYNIQFVGGRPMLIDLLSFEQYQEGQPWIAYRQFCEHFLGPLLLLSKTDIRLGYLLRTYLDGIPVPLVSRLMPKSTWVNPAILSHIHLHAFNQQKHEGNQRRKEPRVRISLWMLRGIIAGLEKIARKLDITLTTEWGEYYRTMNYSRSAQQSKKKIVARMMQSVKPHQVWDLGANTGAFSRLASEHGIAAVAIDADPWAVEQNYRQMKKNQENNLLPLYMDLSNPSPNQGWGEKERQSLSARGPADLVMALAILHHLCLTHNLPFAHIASYLRCLGRYLIVEFVPKEDSNARLLLARKKDIFPWYNMAGFETDFGRYFQIRRQTPVGHGSKRVIYLMEAKKRPANG